MMLIFCLSTIAVTSCAQKKTNALTKKTTIMEPKDSLPNTDSLKVTKTDAEWKQLLPADVYMVARQKGTERPWTSKYENSKEVGTYYCRVCGNALFQSDTKFESGCGWPSFYQPITKNSMLYEVDNSHGMTRTEVKCGKCDSHLGHVFEDGPPPTGLRYCINGVVLDFKTAEKAKAAFDAKQKEKE